MLSDTRDSFLFRGSSGFIECTVYVRKEVQPYLHASSEHLEILMELLSMCIYIFIFLILPIYCDRNMWPNHDKQKLTSLNPNPNVASHATHLWQQRKNNGGHDARHESKQTTDVANGTSGQYTSL